MLRIFLKLVPNGKILADSDQPKLSSNMLWIVMTSANSKTLQLMVMGLAVYVLCMVVTINLTRISKKGVDARNLGHLDTHNHAKAVKWATTWLAEGWCVPCSPQGSTTSNRMANSSVPTLPTPQPIIEVVHPVGVSPTECIGGFSCGFLFHVSTQQK